MHLNWECMSCVIAKRKDQLLRLAYDNAVNTNTGECKLGHDDGNFILTIIGLHYEEQMKFVLILMSANNSINP